MFALTLSGTSMLALFLLLVFPQHVAAHRFYGSADAAPTAYQPRDMASAPIGPYYVLVGENQGFCVVTDKEFASVLDGEVFDCRWQPLRY